MEIIYNLTIKVNSSIAEEWLAWLKNEHINDVLGTKCFTRVSVLRLLETDESEGPTYAVQYFAANFSDYNKYLQIFSGSMRQKSFDKWGDKFIAFRSVMEVIN